MDCLLFKNPPIKDNLMNQLYGVSAHLTQVELNCESKRTETDSQLVIKSNSHLLWHSENLHFKQPLFERLRKPSREIQHAKPKHYGRLHK